MSLPKRSIASRYVSTGNGSCRNGRSGTTARLTSMAIRSTQAMTSGLRDEAHLQVQLGELRLPVATQVLVAEAAGDLEVAVHARDHEQLLELLRALGQRVDAARLEPRGHDEVPGALRRRLDEQRGLDLHEARRVMGLADLLHEPAARQDASLEGLAPDVEIAVLQAHRLVDVRVRVVDDEGRRLRRREHLDVRARSSTAPVASFGVLRAGQPRGDVPPDLEHELRADRGGDLVRRLATPGHR